VEAGGLEDLNVNMERLLQNGAGLGKARQKSMVSMLSMLARLFHRAQGPQTYIVEDLIPGPVHLISGYGIQVLHHLL
jgi:hypothetical protein